MTAVQRHETGRVSRCEECVPQGRLLGCVRRYRYFDPANLAVDDIRDWVFADYVKVNCCRLAVKDNISMNSLCARLTNARECLAPTSNQNSPPRKIDLCGQRTGTKSWIVGKVWAAKV